MPRDRSRNARARTSMPVALNVTGRAARVGLRLERFQFSAALFGLFNSAVCGRLVRIGAGCVFSLSSRLLVVVNGGFAFVQPNTVFRILHQGLPTGTSKTLHA